jgi:hypothetical protein
MKTCCHKNPLSRPKINQALEIINHICIEYPVQEENDSIGHVFLNNDRVSKLESQLQETTLKHKVTLDTSFM